MAALPFLSDPGDHVSREPLTAGRPLFFHRTRGAAAQAIIQGGFRDAEGHYLTDRVWRGVWVSDRPLEEGGKEFDALLGIRIARGLIEPWEWVEDGKDDYREFLVPAAVLNESGIVGIIQDNDSSNPDEVPA